MTTYIHYAVIISVALLVAFYGYEFYKGFVSTPGNVWARLLAAGKGSATILWSRFLAIFAGTVALLGDFGSYVGAPGVADNIQHYVKPEYVPAFLVLIAVINEFARRRTLTP